MENTGTPVPEEPVVNVSEETAAPEAAAPEATAAAPEQASADNFNKTNVMAYSVLSYFAILWLLGLLIPPENASPIVKNHVNNGILLFGGEIIAGILYMIPYVGRYALGPLLSLVIFVFAILGIVKAIKCEKYTLPIIGDKVTLIK